jgi:hypothetical protein
MITACAPILFPMAADLYYAVERQLPNGKMQKEWFLDRTIRGNFHFYKTRRKEHEFKYDKDNFYKLDTTLVGRTHVDVRKSSDEEYFPLSHIIMTNIRPGDCNDDAISYYIEADNSETPTLFEIRTAVPFINPFGKIEYYKIELVRQDLQELNILVEDEG